MNTSPTLESTTRPSLSGYLRVDCERRPSGQCVLARKEFKSPVHISKPYWDGNTLLLNLMCPTAGMLENDSVSLETRVKSTASLTLSNPSSLRIHKMVNGGEANWKQHFKVEPHAFLESNPEWLILQGQSSFTQRTQIEVEAGGELFFIEAIAAGRIAHREAFAFTRFRNRLSLSYGDKLALLEKHSIAPALGNASGWMGWNVHTYPFYVSILIVSERLESDSELWNLIFGLQSDDLRIGSSELAIPSCWSVKLLSRDPVSARKAVAKVRDLFFEATARKPAALRRQ